VVYVGVGEEDAVEAQFPIEWGVSQTGPEVIVGDKVLAVDAFQGREQFHFEEVQQAHPRAWFEVFLEEQVSSAEGGTEVEREAGIAVSQEDLVASNFIDAAVAGDSDHLPSFSYSNPAARKAALIGSE